MKPSSQAARGWSAIATFGAAGLAAAQPCQPAWTEGFTNRPGFNNEVRAVAYFDDGAGPVLYAAGHFSTVGGLPIPGIARWTGESWGSLSAGGLAPVGANIGAFTMSVHDLGSGPSLYVGGTFSSAGGVPAARIARWDGAAWSPLAAGVNNTVRMMTTYDDGSGPALYVAGLFTSASGSPARGIARWDGEAWSQVGGGLQGNGGAGYSVSVLDLGDGPNLYVGGWFEQPTPQGPARNIARWDGTGWSALGSGVYDGSTYSPFVMVMRVFDHGQGPQLTVGGRFTLIPETPSAPRVARWTGSQWLQVGSDLGRNDEYVNSLVEHDGPQGRTLYVGGSFSSAVWLNSVNYIARLGAGDWIGLEGGMDTWLRCLMVHPTPSGDRLVAAGIFTEAGSALASRVAEWDGERWNAIFDRGRGLSGVPHAALVHDDGSGARLFVAGQFQSAGTRLVNNIAAWDGDAWDTLGGGVLDTSPVQPAIVSALAEYTDGAGAALYAAGRFVLAGNGPCQNIARWDGGTWQSLGGSGPNGHARCLCVHDDGSGEALYVGGQFNAAAGIPVRGLARWDGLSWSDVQTGPGSNGSWYIGALASFDDGTGPRLYAGGFFTEMGQATGLTGFAAWDGANWTSAGDVRRAGGAPGEVMALMPWGGSLVAAGSFNFVSGVGATNAARWDGQAWHGYVVNQPYEPLGPSITSGGVYALAGAAQSLWVGGWIIPNGPAGPSYGLTRWNGSWSGLNPSVLGSGAKVRALAAWTRGGVTSLFAGGEIASAGGQPTSRLAEYRLCPCPADCNGDGTLSAADFGCFQTRFGLADPYADCNADGALNLADFGCFQTGFALGCP